MSIRIPAGVAAIGRLAFDGCTGLTAIDVDAANTKYSSISGVLYDKAKATLLRFPAGRKGSFAIPGSVTGINEAAFDGCISLTAVTIPPGVKVIGRGAFMDCSALTAFVVPTGVTALADGVFNGCGKLKSVTLPAGLVSIGFGTFNKCTSLASVSLPASVTSIDYYSFYDCTGLLKAVFAGKKPSFGEEVFGNAKAGFKVCYNITQTSWSAFTAYPKQPYCVATIYPQNGSAATKAMIYIVGGHIASPAAPTRAGYSFSGWYKDAACTHPWHFTTDAVTGNVSLYAKWIALQPAH